MYASLINPDILNPQYLKVYVINNTELRLLEVPKGAPNVAEKPKYWDIGFVSGKLNSQIYITIYVEVKFNLF